MGLLADAQGARGCGLLHPRGNMDGGAADAAVLVDAAAKQYRAGVNTDANVEAGAAELPCHEQTAAPAFVDQRESGLHGALGVVFGGDLGSEHGEQPIAGVLQDLAAMAFDDRAGPHEHAIEHNVHVLGVEILSEQSRPHHVHEQDADLSQLLRLGVGPLRQCAQLLAHRLNAGVNGSITQGRALRLERSDCRFDRMAVVHAAVPASPADWDTSTSGLAKRGDTRSPTSGWRSACDVGPERVHSVRVQGWLSKRADSRLSRSS